MFPLRYMSGFYADADSLIKALNCFATGRYAMGHLWFLPSFLCALCCFISYIGLQIRGGVYTDSYNMLPAFVSV